jgi:uncharacterized damage-inducible protein DinB
MALSREMFLTHLMIEYGRTRHYLGTFRNQDLDFRPAKALMTIREYALHLMGCHNYLLKAVMEGNFDYANFKMPHAINDIRQALVLSDDHYRALRDGIRSLTDDQFNRKVFVFGRDMLLSDLALDILVHEGHHRGQLSIALRLRGLTPPDVYMQMPPLVED